ncbi:protein rep, partial [Streptococcus suis]
NNYISQEEWAELWAKSLTVHYVPKVDIRSVKDQGKGLHGAILETAKYPMKPFDLSIENAQVVDDLYNRLYRKRQFGYG